MSIYDEASGAYFPTLSDTVPLARPIVAFRANALGNVKVTTDEGDEIVIPVLAGETIPLRCRLLWANGTTLSGAQILCYTQRLG